METLFLIFILYRAAISTNKQCNVTLHSSSTESQRLLNSLFIPTLPTSYYLFKSFKTFAVYTTCH